MTLGPLSPKREKSPSVRAHSSGMMIAASPAGTDTPVRFMRREIAGVSVPAGDAAIIIPEEWARTQGDFSRFGLSGPNVIPFVSVSEGGAVNGQAPNPYEGNAWVMGSVLSAFILAHQAGLRPALPREADDWQVHPMVLLPSPLTATDPIFVHLHTDFWKRADPYVRGGGVV